jgi:hypothetical protein
MKVTFAAAALALTACTPVEFRDRPSSDQSSPASCKPDVLGDLVGKRASDARADMMQSRSGARTLRWIAPDTAVTMDFRPDRLNVYVDSKGRITRFTCA